MLNTARCLVRLQRLDFHYPFDIGQSQQRLQRHACECRRPSDKKKREEKEADAKAAKEAKAKAATEKQEKAATEKKERATKRRKI